MVHDSIRSRSLNKPISDFDKLVKGSIDWKIIYDAADICLRTLVVLRGNLYTNLRRII